MTLILSVVTENAVYQISDRRLTDPENPEDQIDNEANKVVFVNRDWIFGYTGIASVLNQPVDRWFVDAVTASKPSPYFDEQIRQITHKASSDFRREPCHPAFKQQAFQGVGWFQDGNTWLPAVTTIENAINWKTRGWLPVAKNWFDWKIEALRLPKGQIYISTVGQRLNKGDMAYMRKLLKKCAAKTITGYAVAVALLHLMIQRFQYDTVGKSGMLVCIPRPQAQRPSHTINLSGMPNIPGGMNTFQHYSQTGRTVQSGPHMASAGRTGIVDFQGTGGFGVVDSTRAFCRPTFAEWSRAVDAWLMGRKKAA